MRSDFENIEIEGIRASRYVASFLNELLRQSYHDQLRAWLKSLVIHGRHLTEDEIWLIYNIGACGKMELEHDVKRFLSLPEEEQEKWEEA